MKTSIKIVAGVTAAVLGAGIIGNGIYQASVHEQICRSYERQALSEATDAIVFLDKTINILTTIKESPLSALGYLGQLGPMNQESVEIKTARNNTLYAYDGTCGQNRRLEWVARPEVKSVFDRLTEKANTVKNF
jgi:hypothetical protein